MSGRQPVQRERTHILTVEVPIHIGPEFDGDYDPLQTALNVVMSVSRLAVDGVVCGDVTVHLSEVSP